MALKAIVYLIIAGIAAVASVCVHPQWGVFGYVATYNINPLSQWWGRDLPEMVRRYGLIFSTVTLFGYFIHFQKISGHRRIVGSEIWLVMLLGAVWLSVWLGRAGDVTYNVVKTTKFVFMILLATRILTKRQNFETLILVLIGAAMYLALSVQWGEGAFHGGRFDRGVGGSDFREGNFLAAHFAFLLPFLGVSLLTGRWKVKLLCLLAAPWIVNALIITRSRGAFLSILVGALVTLFQLPRLRSHRKKIFLLMLVGLIGAFSLTDQDFWERMGSITVEREDLDVSAQSRIEAWKAALAMAKDYPLGVGAGKFLQYVEQYNPLLAGRDTHNTYLRCLAELGVQGLTVLFLLIASSFYTLRRVSQTTRQMPERIRSVYDLYQMASGTALIIYLTAAVFISSVYIEEFYWFLMFPVFLLKSAENELAEQKAMGMERLSPTTDGMQHGEDGSKEVTADHGKSFHP